MLYYRLNLLNQNQAQLIAAELMAAAWAMTDDDFGEYEMWKSVWFVSLLSRDSLLKSRRPIRLESEVSTFACRACV